MTVDLTVKPLKTDEKAGISENNKITTKRLKCLDKGLGQAEKESETPPAKSGLILSQATPAHFAVIE